MPAPTELVSVERGLGDQKRTPLVQKPALHRGEPGGGETLEAAYLCRSQRSTGASPVGAERGDHCLLVQKPLLHRGEPGGGGAPSGLADRLVQSAARRWCRAARTVTYRFQGRDFRLTDVRGKFVKQILASLMVFACRRSSEQEKENWRVKVGWS